jgi:serine/threonine-protein kinase
VAAGADHTCATTVSGVLKCWGESFDGGPDVAGPQALLMGSKLLQVAAGTQFTCAATDQEVDCFGALMLSGAAVPYSTSLTAGARHACAISQGRVYCWGDNTRGQLGIAGADGGFISYPTPVDGLVGFVTQVAAGTTHTCALLGGEIWCWGRFDATQSTAFDSPVPVRVEPMINTFHFIASGAGVSCGAYDGAGVCWGTAASAFDGYAVSLGVGSGFACAVMDDGGAECWGSNTHGQLGAPDAGASSPMPVAVSGLGNVRAVTCGRAHACAIADNLQVWCWGEGAHDKIGSGNAMDAPAPVHVSD